jgi:hypothetical protein
MRSMKTKSVKIKGRKKNKELKRMKGKKEHEKKK